MLNLFSTKKRTKSQSLTDSPHLPGGSNDQKTQEYLKKEHLNQLEKFSYFLTNHYGKFDYKINRCNFNCIKQTRSYKQIAECQKNCGQGVKKFSAFVDTRIEEMQTLLNDCVDQTRSLANTLDEVYRCYIIYNQSFEQLKLFIQEESMFYD